VVFPSDVGYALYGHSDESMQLMYQIKARPLTKPCVAICNLDILTSVALLSAADRKVIEAIALDYPSAFIVRANMSSPLLLGLNSWALKQVISDGCIAVFLNTGPLTEKLVALGAKDSFLIIGSSANPSSTGNRYTLQDLEASITSMVHGVFDGGACRYDHPLKRGTTIINLQTRTIERIGVLSKEICSKLVELGLQWAKID